jgi:sugar phosphate isomerase/epimerase
MRARDNPFTVQRIHALSYRLEGTTWEALLERLEALGFRAALVGPHGHGKSTLLKEIAARLETRGLRVRKVLLHEGDRWLTREQRRTLLQGVTPRDLVLLDGAEQLCRPAWLHLQWRSRRAAGLLVTSHRPGLLPTLHECRTGPALLAALVGELLGKKGEEIQVEELFTRHRGNVREALRELYDLQAATPL